MPFTPPPRIPSGPRRRTLLASAAGTTLLVGCSATAEDTGGGRSSAPSLAQRVRARAARDSTDLARRYDAVLTAHPSLAPRLAPLRAETVRHAEAFGARPAGSGVSGSPSVSPTSSPTGSPGASPTGSPVTAPDASPVVPADEKAAVALLAGAEKELADRRTETLADVDGELARLLASVAAAGAAHVYLLTTEAAG
ncbi:hypothetical protein JS756_27940 [Streptomyces actuosus]|uniref:Lipoprotein n=1 Tax=Streptomyces actuosus TaxID=1885 RepID=A0ABS2VXJ6_STRAS|nr:hypothetical protein [Streptomyces actuosus]MBN0047875.1 hypothetical protein [Streptomyces actuosus]